MGKIKQVIMGDEVAEEATRKKAESKRAQKKLAQSKKETSKKEGVVVAEKLAEKPKEAKKVSKAKGKDVPSHGKKYNEIKNLVDKKRIYPVTEAVTLVKKTSYSTFDGTVEVVLNVLEKGIRGTVSLPHGTGKTIRVKVADDGLIDAISHGAPVDFDILVAHPSMMPKLARIAKILGPKGLMPNPKTGTIGENPEELAVNLAKGQVNYKTEADFPIIHSVIGKVSFEDKKLMENLAALIKSVGKDKIVSAFLKPTMGPSVRIAI